jgi:V8-like Glu-specific endopeptidase
MQQWVLPVSAAVFAALSGCGVPSTPSVGRLQAAIGYGKPSQEYPSAGALVFHPEDGETQTICSVNLVGRRTALTAAHCVLALEDPTFSVDLDTESYRVTGIRTRGAAATTDDQLETGVDLAVLRLAKSPSIEPTPVATQEPRVGTEVQLVGYGVTHYNRDDAGTKRVGSNRLFKVHESHLQYVGGGDGHAALCPGDSGGPTFASVRGQPVQIGVHSFGVSPHCGRREFDERLDVSIEWLESVSAGDIELIDAQPGAICDSDDPDVLARECVQGCNAGTQPANLPYALLLVVLGMLCVNRRRPAGDLPDAG